MLYFNGALTNVSLAVALALSILVISLTVHLVLWVNDSITAREFNKALKVLQSSRQAEENENS